MSRVVKSLFNNGPGISGHRHHHSQRGFKKSYWSAKIARKARDRKLKKFVRKEMRDLTHVD